MSFVIRTVAFVVLCLGFSIGCTQCEQVDSEAEALAIRELDRQLLAACMAKDLDQVMSFYSPVAVEMQPGQPAIEGVAAIREWFESWVFTEGLTNTFEPDVIEVAASGDLAVDRGHWKEVMETPDGQHVREGKYVVIWRKIDGQWKVVVDIANSNGPAGE